MRKKDGRRSSRSEAKNVGYKKGDLALRSVENFFRPVATPPNVHCPMVFSSTYRKAMMRMGIYLSPSPLSSSSSSLYGELELRAHRKWIVGVVVSRP